MRTAKVNKEKISQVRVTNNANYVSIFQTACYKNYYNIYISEKEGSGQQFRKLRAIQLRVTNTLFRGQNQPAKAFNDIKNLNYLYYAILAQQECLLLRLAARLLWVGILPTQPTSQLRVVGSGQVAWVGCGQGGTVGTQWVPTTRKTLPTLKRRLTKPLSQNTQNSRPPFRTYSTS